MWRIALEIWSRHPMFSWNLQLSPIPNLTLWERPPEAQVPLWKLPAAQDHTDRVFKLLLKDSHVTSPDLFPHLTWGWGGEGWKGHPGMLGPISILAYCISGETYYWGIETFHPLVMNEE